MILADAAHRDPTTGKFTLLGTFSAMGSAEFPTVLKAVIYFAITDGLGTHRISIRFVDAKDLVDVCSDPDEDPGDELEFVDPIAVVEGVVKVVLNIPKPGVYHIELLCGESVLMSRRLLVEGPIDNPPQEPGDE